MLNWVLREICDSEVVGQRGDGEGVFGGEEIGWSEIRG